MTRQAAQTESENRGPQLPRRRSYYALLSGSMLGVMFAVTFASGAWNEASLPVGEVVARDAFVDAFISGVVRMHGSDFTLYSGTRIQSLDRGLDVNLERGGTVSLCPRSVAHGSQPFSSRSVVASTPSMENVQRPGTTVAADNTGESPQLAASTGKRRQRSQDVAGYVASAVHFLFGR